MTDAVLTRVLNRDRAIIALALALVVVLAWAYVLWFAARMDMPGTDSAMGMSGMDMSNMKMPMPGMLMPALKPWTAVQFAVIFAMWTVMMIGMMLPSAAPMVLIYARVGRQAALEGKPFAPTAWFLSGYVAMWTAFALAATATQWGLEELALLTPMMASASNRFGGLVLIVAGLYQWTRLKDVCLVQCRMPLLFIQSQGGFKRDKAGSLRLGLLHGLYCVGCCWALMALLFVLGVMNVLWIAALAALVLLEKVTPAGRIVARGAGIAFAGAGLWLLVAPH